MSHQSPVHRSTAWWRVAKMEGEEEGGEVQVEEEEEEGGGGGSLGGLLLFSLGLHCHIRTLPIYCHQD